MASQNKRKGNETPKKSLPDCTSVMASQSSPPTSQKSSFPICSNKSPKTPSQKTGSPGGTAKYSPHFSRKKRRKLFKELSAEPDKPDKPVAVQSSSKSTIKDFFSRVKPPKLVPCPVCHEEVALSSINKHLDKGCLDLDMKDNDDFIEEPATKSKVKRIKRSDDKTSQASRTESEASLSCSPRRKIVEVKSDLKDKRTRLRLKRKIESHSLYSSQRVGSDVSKNIEAVENPVKLSTTSPRICSTSDIVTTSEYFDKVKSKKEDSKPNSEILKPSGLMQRLSSPVTTIGLISSKEKDSSLLHSKDGENDPQSLERKLSNASECSTVILSSQSQDFPEAQEDVFMMYSKSSVRSPCQGSSNDFTYDTSPEYKHKLSMTASGYLKFDYSTQNLTYKSMASDGEESVLENGDTSLLPSTCTSNTSSGISSQYSSSAKSCLPLAMDDSQTSIADSKSSEDTSPSFPQSQSSQNDRSSSQHNCEESIRPSPYFPVTSSSISTSSNLISENSRSPNRTSLETSPQKRSSSWHSQAQEGTPSKKAAAESSPANSPWKYRDPYFLVNFKLILNTVLSNQDDQSLFNDEDMTVINAFRDLSAPSQQLYVRLFQRKHAWLQVAKLDYKRIAEDLTHVVAELHEADLIQCENDLSDLEASLNLCPALDLKTITKTLRLSPSVGQTKQDLVAALLKHARQQRSLFAGGTEKVIMKKVKKVLGPCLHLSNEPRIIFSRLLLLFSLTTDMDDDNKASGGMSQLQTLLLSNMGKVIYPVYTVMRTVKIFATRDDLIRYEAALHYENDVATAMSTNDLELAYQIQQSAMNTYQEIQRDDKIHKHDLSLPVFLRCFTAFWTYIRIMYSGVEILQKLRRYADAVDTLQHLLKQTDYCQDSRGRWWDRLALNLDQHLKKPEQALDAIKEGLGDSYVKTGHRLALQLRAQKILKSASNKRLKKHQDDFIFFPVREMPRVTIEGRVLPYQAPGIRNTFVREWRGCKTHDDDMAICSVEEVALQHYKTLGYQEGVHGEGSTFTTLIFLLFWEQIFMEGIPDTFCYPYQSGPLDLRSDAFFSNRQEALESRLAEIRQAGSKELQDWLERSWTEYKNEQCSGVNWDLFHDLQHAQSLLVCFGGEFLSAVAERILKNHRHCRGGMPDLTVWNPDSHQFKLVEVKGPGDRLSHKQILWIDFFLSQGVDAEVCHVTAVGSKRLKLSQALSKNNSASSSGQT